MPVFRYETVFKPPICGHVIDNLVRSNSLTSRSIYLELGPISPTCQIYFHVCSRCSQHWRQRRAVIFKEPKHDRWRGVEQHYVVGLIGGRFLRLWCIWRWWPNRRLSVLRPVSQMGRVRRPVNLNRLGWQLCLLVPGQRRRR